MTTLGASSCKPRRPTSIAAMLSILALINAPSYAVRSVWYSSKICREGFSHTMITRRGCPFLFRISIYSLPMRFFSRTV